MIMMVRREMFVQKIFLRQTESIRKTRQKTAWLSQQLEGNNGDNNTVVNVFQIPYIRDNNDRPSSIERSEAE